MVRVSRPSVDVVVVVVKVSVCCADEVELVVLDVVCSTVVLDDADVPPIVAIVLGIAVNFEVALTVV